MSEQQVLFVIAAIGGKMGRLTYPIAKPATLKGMWTREQRLYLVYSLALQENPDQEQALNLLERMKRRGYV